MTNATLQIFRTIAAEMIGQADWQWIGPNLSQRMFGITQERAEAYAKAHGGRAEKMAELSQTYVCWNCHERAIYGKPHACEQVGQ